jgi:hypothetical protein
LHVYLKEIIISTVSELDVKFFCLDLMHHYHSLLNGLDQIVDTVVYGEHFVLE